MRRILLAVVAVLLVVGIGYSYAEPVFVQGGQVGVQENYKITNITATNDNNVLKAGPGLFAGITVNGGTMGAIVAYDNTTCSGTTIGTWASPFASQVIPGGGVTTTGLCISTADNTNITVYWK